jgi:membrane protease YdiL (CAAX protease family)
LAAFLASKSSSVQKISPELKLKDWYPRHLILSASVWVCYLFGYELLFRGILWFLCRSAFGFWPALIINLALYSLVHLPKGKELAVSVIPAGVIFCLLSELTGSFLPAFLIHSSIAILTEEFSIYHNPALHIHLRKRTV